MLVPFMLFIMCGRLVLQLWRAVKLNVIDRFPRFVVRPWWQNVPDLLVAEKFVHRWTAYGCTMHTAEQGLCRKGVTFVVQPRRLTFLRLLVAQVFPMGTCLVASYGLIRL